MILQEAYVFFLIAAPPGCSVNTLNGYLIASQIWNHYDSDRSGYLEGEEIEAFLKDMLEQQGCCPNPQCISDYRDFIVSIFSY